MTFPASITVWGCMSSNDVGSLCFLNTTVNSSVYQDILDGHMIGEFIYQHDLAPAHASKSTAKWLADRHVQVLEWPANSLDANPIEFLWAIAKRRLQKLKPSTKEELKAAIQQIWTSITQEDCARLVQSMSRRIAAIIRSKGVPTRY